MIYHSLSAVFGHKSQVSWVSWLPADEIDVSGAVKKAQQSPWISSIWKPTGFNISHSKKELSNLEKRVQQTQRHKNCVFADY